jgi:hypothetical protein
MSTFWALSICEHFHVYGRVYYPSQETFSALSPNSERLDFRFNAYRTGFRQKRNGSPYIDD